MDLVKQLKKDLEDHINPEKAAFLPKFFQMYPGGYGEGDQILGVMVPDQRKIARRYFRQLSFDQYSELLTSSIHEHRLIALFMLVYLYEKEKDQSRKETMVNFYLNHLDHVNNWDLVDSSAHKILGEWLIDKDKDLLFELANTDHLWRQRVAIIATLAFIKRAQVDTTFEISEVLLNHPHDLIHKAVGWMLREVGKVDEAVERDFLDKHYQNMPRTMLRYAIEKFDPELRKAYLNGLI